MELRYPTPLCDDTRVVPLPSADAGRYTALLLFSHAAAESRHAAARLSDDVRVRTYLGAPRGRRSAHALRVDDEAAYEASVDDCVGPYMHLPWRSSERDRIGQEARGPRRWFAGLTVVGALVTAYDAETLPDAVVDVDESRTGELGRLAAAVVRLPDGRYAAMPGAYGPETTCGFSFNGTAVVDVIAYPLVCAIHRGLYRAAWWYVQGTETVLQDVWPGQSWDEAVCNTADALDESLASSSGAAAQLAAALSPAEAEAVRDALRPHMARFAARRVSAERIRRAWLRYDGAPHGPRGRFLRDLERGWRSGPHCGDGSDHGGDALRLFVDRAAYGAYAADRREELRRVMSRSPASAHVALRIASLLELKATT